MPVFIGPVYGGAMELSAGRHDNALGAIHLMAGRLNVGYLCECRWRGPYLLLRGQVVADRQGPRSQFGQLWGYVQRFGSRQTKT
jgi:hypothetical protein